MDMNKSAEDFAMQYAQGAGTLTFFVSMGAMFHMSSSWWDKFLLSLLYSGTVATGFYLAFLFFIHFMYSDFYLYLVKAFAEMDNVDVVETIPPVTTQSHRLFQVVNPVPQSNVPASPQNNQRDTNVTQSINAVNTGQILDSVDTEDNDDNVDDIEEVDDEDDDNLPVPIVRVQQTQNVTVSLGNRELTRYVESVLSGPFIQLGDSSIKYDGHPNYLRRLFDYYWGNTEDTFSKTSFAQHIGLNRFDSEVKNQLDIMEKWLGQHGLLSNSVRNNRRCLTDLGMKVFHPPTPSV